MAILYLDSTRKSINISRNNDLLYSIKYAKVCFKGFA